MKFLNKNFIPIGLLLFTFNAESLPSQSILDFSGSAEVSDSDYESSVNSSGDGSDDESTPARTRGEVLGTLIGRPNIFVAAPDENATTPRTISSGSLVRAANAEYYAMFPDLEGASTAARASRNSTDPDRSGVEEFRITTANSVNVPDSTSPSSSALSSTAGAGSSSVLEETHSASYSTASSPAAANSSGIGAGTGVQTFHLSTGGRFIQGTPVSQSYSTAIIEDENSFDLQWNKEASGQLDLSQCATPSNFTTKDLLSAARKSAVLNRFIWNLLKFDLKGSMDAIKECSNAQEAIRKLVQHGIDKMMDRNKPVARYVVDPELEKLSSDNGYNNEASSSIITPKNVAIAAVVIAAAGGVYYYRNEIKAGAKKAYDKSKQGINWLLGKDDELKKQQEAFNKANEEQKNKNRSWFGFGK